MHPNLVCAACVGMGGDESRCLEIGHHLEFSDRFSPPAGNGQNGHALAVAGMASDGNVDDAALRFQAAMHEGKVSFFDAAGFELRLQMPVRSIILGNQNDAGGVFIQAVDDARSLYSPHPFQIRAMMEDGIDERTAGMTGGGVHDHAGGFVHGDEVIIFVKDVEQDRFGCGGCRRGRGDVDVDHITGEEALADFGGACIDQRIAVTNPALDFGAGVRGQVVGKIAVEPVGGVADSE